MVSLVDEVYKQVNTQEILAYCGTKLDLSSGASDKQRLAVGMEYKMRDFICVCSQMEKARKILIDCLISEVHNNMILCS